MISDHEVEALSHSRITEFHKFFSEYHIWLEVALERFKMKIRIYETNDGRFYFVQSHHVLLPHQKSDFQPTTLNHDSAHMALSTAVASVTTYYEDAVASGHEPSLDWFVPNVVF